MQIKVLTSQNVQNSGERLLVQQATLNQEFVITFDELDADQRKRLNDLSQQFYVNTTETDTGLIGVFDGSALSQFIEALADQPAFDSLQKIQSEHAITWQAGRYTYDLTHSGLVYAILNTTPDSFYDGGQYFNMDDVMAHVSAMIEQGADIIEVGGQSTRPGYTEISSQAEIDRIMPFIKAIQQTFPDIAIAVDTYKPDVMRAVIDAGVDIINDINGFTDDSAKLTLMHDSKVGMVSMLNRRLMDEPISYANIIDTFTSQINAFKDAGIDLKRVSLDPGVGFSTVGNLNNDLGLMHGIKQLNQFHLPVMAAVSNKSYLQKLLGLAKDDRVTMTLITEALLYTDGNRILRVHNVEETAQMRQLLDSITASYLA
ncbi:dihydropteroate synthase [Weissella viridescens]|uniref:Dihydropteroate synthase n=1 Tax=Weissella viridescens TaxID=1629 RepID=A0A3P2RCA1_WEIVI|nr:dihydropteroate synthase [Weissella viridescens]RRG18379.1 dihydropteroate synthase [Weissella viridescens]